jgi:hypothetical protein
VVGVGPSAGATVENRPGGVADVGRRPGGQTDSKWVATIRAGATGTKTSTANHVAANGGRPTANYLGKLRGSFTTRCKSFSCPALDSLIIGLHHFAPRLRPECHHYGTTHSSNPHQPIWTDLQLVCATSNNSCMDNIVSNFVSCELLVCNVPLC